MANSVLLNNEDHAELKVIARYDAAFGDNVNMALVVPTEFGEAQRDYPILFRKDESGAFQALALLGFDKGENLFLTEDGWDARHIPTMHQRGPFSIGFQNQDVDGEMRREQVLFIDMDDPRVGTAEGQPLFREHGGNTPYLDHISHIMRVLSAGTELQKPMFAIFEEAGILEPVSLDVTLDEHTKYSFKDFFTIDENRLAALKGDLLERMHREGYIRAAYMVLASLPNMSRLIARKNARRAAAQG